LLKKNVNGEVKNISLQMKREAV
jgi:hypothetical protein